jgi:hypothetical protein
MLEMTANRSRTDAATATASSSRSSAIDKVNASAVRGDDLSAQGTPCGAPAKPLRASLRIIYLSTKPLIENSYFSQFSTQTANGIRQLAVQKLFRRDSKHDKNAVSRRNGLD